MTNSEGSNMTVENRQNESQVGMDATAGSGTTQTQNTLEGMNPTTTRISRWFCTIYV